MFCLRIICGGAMVVFCPFFLASIFANAAGSGTNGLRANVTLSFSGGNGVISAVIVTSSAQVTSYFFKGAPAARSLSPTRRAAARIADCHVLISQ